LDEDTTVETTHEIVFDRTVGAGASRRVRAQQAELRVVAEVDASVVDRLLLFLLVQDQNVGDSGQSLGQVGDVAVAEFVETEDVVLVVGGHEEVRLEHLDLVRFHLYKQSNESRLTSILQKMHSRNVPPEVQLPKKKTKVNL
jgi:hypothetical protein